MRILMLLFAVYSTFGVSNDAEIRQYLLSHPEVVHEALELYQKNIKLEKLKDVFSAKESQIVVENADGENTLMMFIDYRCGACRRVYPWVASFIKNHGDVRLVLKPYPVLGAESVQAALMMYDANKEGKASALNRELIDFRHSFGNERLRTLSKEYQVNVHLPSMLDKHWAFPLLEQNHHHSVELENKTVPFFILKVGDEYKMLHGISSKEELEQVYKQMS